MPDKGSSNPNLILNRIDNIFSSHRFLDFLLQIIKSIFFLLANEYICLILLIGC